MVQRPSKPVLMGAVFALLLLVGVCWAAFGGYFTSAEEQLVDDSPYSVAALKESDPGDIMKKMRSDELTDEERDELRHNVRQVWRDRMDEAMTEYFTAPEDEKVAILDRQIDKWMAMRKRMEEMREEDPPTEEEEQRWRERMRSRTFPDYAERKERYESGQSEDRSRMMTYMMAAQQRAEARGLDMGSSRWGGRGRGGGSGASPGGAGRGRGSKSDS